MNIDKVFIEWHNYPNMACYNDVSCNSTEKSNWIDRVRLERKNTSKFPFFFIIIIIIIIFFI